MIAPSGRGVPPLNATNAFPSATSEVAKSRMTGGSSGRGIPQQKGEVLPRRSTPPKGATSRLPRTLTM